MMLQGKKVLVTGGTAGIGRAIVELFVKEGAEVFFFGTNEERGQSVAQSCGATFFKVDVSLTDKVHEVIEQIGPVDILVNNAGIVRDCLLMRMSEEDWDAVLNTNLKSVYNTCHALVRHFLKARKGKIINITSVVGLTGNAGQVNYAASKAGMIGFSKSLALEVAGRGICVNCIAPGFIETNMTGALDESQKAAILQKVPMGRLGRPEEIAQAALFLASDHSNYITGQVLTVDGGMVM